MAMNGVKYVNLVKNCQIIAKCKDYNKIYEDCN